MSLRDYVTLRVGGQLFGVDAARVHDDCHPRGLTPVPLSRAEIAGVLNLRGRIVTAVCARRRLGLPPREEGAPEPLAIGLEVHGDSYGLVIDSVDEVLKLDDEKFHAPPGNLPPRWAEIIVGVYQLEKELLIVLDPHTLLDAAHLKAASAA
jgi:purine-binding chemotaxis protein CheW